MYTDKSGVKMSVLIVAENNM